MTKKNLQSEFSFQSCAVHCCSSSRTPNITMRIREVLYCSLPDNFVNPLNLSIRIRNFPVAAI